MSGAGPAPLTLQQALDLAEQRAPSLRARHASADGAEQARTSAGQLPDPKLAVGIENLPISGPDRFSWNRDPMTMRRIGVVQDVPNAAKRAAQRDGADATVERERALLQAERLAVRRDAALAWIARHYAERKLALFATLERENRLLQDTIAPRIASGKAMPADALAARQESLALAERRDELQAAADQAAAALQRWTVDPPADTSPEAPAIPVDVDGLLGRLDRHAELLAFAPMLAMARAQAGEAQAAERGDWGWEVGYGNRRRAYGDMVSFQLTFELPLFAATRQAPRLAARLKEIDRLEAEREDASRRLRGEVESQASELWRLERALERQRAAGVPLATERARLVLAGYEAGRGDLGGVLAARKEAAEAQWRALDLEAQSMAQRARLAYLIAE